MRPWAVSAGLHLAALLLAVLWWPAGSPGTKEVRLWFGPVRPLEAAPAAAAVPSRRPSATEVPTGDPIEFREASAGPVAEPQPPGEASPGLEDPPEADPELRPPDRRAAELTEYPTPVYPTRLRSRGIEGAVVVGVEVDEAGAVRRVWVATPSGQPEFDRRALEAVQRARFRPAEEDDRTVAGETTVTVRFRLTS